MVEKLFNKLWIKFFIFLVLTLTSYILSIIYLFALHDIIWSITFILSTFVLFHFLFIEIKNLNLRYFFAILAILILIEILRFVVLGREINVRIILSVVAYNWAIWALFSSLKMIDFDSISYFTRWWYIFTLFISVMLSIAFVWMFQKFPFTCQWLNDAWGKLLEFIEKPFTLVFSKKNKKADIEGDIEQETPEWIKNINEVELSSSEWEESKNPIVSKFNAIKANTIDQVLSDKSKHSEWVCDLLLSEINNIMANNGVKRSVIFLSYLLLYWFIRMFVFVASWIAFIIFKILYRTKVYKLVKKTKKVDEVY